MVLSHNKSNHPMKLDSCTLFGAQVIEQKSSVTDRRTVSKISRKRGLGRDINKSIFTNDHPISISQPEFQFQCRKRTPYKSIRLFFSP